MLSNVIPNVPMVVAMVPLVNQYAVGAGLASPVQMDAMRFGAKLGGMVAGSICARAGKPVNFITFLR